MFTRIFCRAFVATIAVFGILTLTSCSASKPSAEITPKTLKLVAYDSFTPGDDAFASFTKQTGIAVEIVKAGDAGTMMSKANLTAGNPEGDVLWGVDNTLISQAVDAKTFTSFAATATATMDPILRANIAQHIVTPVDYGDVCVNYDVAYFSSHSLAVPQTFDDLTQPAYKGLLVVENPATSSTGLAFLLATITAKTPSGFEGYWSSLKANGVRVVDSWDQAYYEQFSGSTGKGPYPLVVSYGSSPPADAMAITPVPETSPTSVMASTCFRQVEYAGILRGTAYPKAASTLIEFLTSKEFQERLPLSLYVYPARADAVLPPEFVKFTVTPPAPLTLPPTDIAKNRAKWIEAFTQATLR